MSKYNLYYKVKNGYMYMETRKGMYSLPQAGMIDNKLLKKFLAKYGYYEVKHTPWFFRHNFWTISFTLVVNNFGVNYVGKEHAKHLLWSLREYYTVSTDWTGGLYCG